MSKDDIYFSWMQNGPIGEEQLSKIKNNECTYTEYTNIGDYEFCCGNKISEYCFSLFPMLEPKKINISGAMLCAEHLTFLSNKYNINFLDSIPRLLFEKGWIEQEYIEQNLLSFPLIIDLKNKIGFNNESDKYNPEFYWWNNHHALIGVPKMWLNDFRLLEYNGQNTKSQGKINGPDFIFKDTKTNKKVGFEITSFSWNVMIGVRELKQIKKIASKKVFRFRSLDDVVLNFKEIIDKKNRKHYVTCDELYLGIVVTDTIMDWEYYVLEIILNKYIKENKMKINGVFVL